MYQKAIAAKSRPTMRVSAQMQRPFGHLLPKRLVSSCADKTRQRLFDAATETLNRRGIQGATTREIARRAGVHEVTLFRHFKSKEQLIRAVLKRGPGRKSRSGIKAANNGNFRTVK
jgi:AcrR family transcriptional regulator